jgi:hypothetical protein
MAAIFAWVVCTFKSVRKCITMFVELAGHLHNEFPKHSKKEFIKSLRYRWKNGVRASAKVQPVPPMLQPLLPGCHPCCYTHLPLSVLRASLLYPWQNMHKTLKLSPEDVPEEVGNLVDLGFHFPTDAEVAPKFLNFAAGKESTPPQTLRARRTPPPRR